MDEFYGILNEISNQYGEDALLCVYTDGSGCVQIRHNYGERYSILDFDSLEELFGKLFAKNP